MDKEGTDGAGVGGMILQPSFKLTGNRRNESHQKLCAPDDLFDLLDDHLLVNIFEKLEDNWDRPAWCLACKRFFAVEASSRKKLRLCKAADIEKALHRYTNVEELELSPHFQVDDATLETVAKLSGPYLRALSLSLVGNATLRTPSIVDNATLKTVEKISKQHFRAWKLGIRRLSRFSDTDLLPQRAQCPISVSRFSETGLLSLVKFCPQLQHLDLSYCSQLTDLGVIAVAQLTKLESLKLVDCRNITDAGLACVAASCITLRLLSLKRCVRLSDTGISSISANCKQLETLDLSYTTLSTVGLTSITNMQNLKNLYLVACNMVNDTGLALLQKNCKSLLVLNVTRCKNVSDRGIMALATDPVALQQLCLAHCPLINGSLFASFMKFQSLQIIELSGCHVASGLGYIGQYCKSLRGFGVRKCRGITDTGICAVANGCPDIQDLDLTCCSDLTDLAVASIASSCKSLRRLKLRGCNMITDTGFVLLGNNCTALDVLSLISCSISDQGLKSFTRCTALRSLKLAGCANITDEGLLCIAASCSNLREVDLYVCNGVGDAGKEALVTSCPKLARIRTRAWWG